MDKKTLTLIGVAGLAVAGLYVWSKSKKNFANLKGPGPQTMPYGTVTAGPNVGQVVFWGPRGAVYLPAGTVPWQQSNGQWMWSAPDGYNYPLTGVGALNQTSIWELI